MKKLWGGRFGNEGCALLDEFNASIGFDHALYAQDIRGSLAHAQMLSECGIISDDDFREISRGLNQIKDEIENGKFEFKVADEDIHMAIESRLSEIIGANIGGKLHTARSRNDQVALDFRLFVLENGREIAGLVLDLIRALTQISSKHIDTLMPGYTHLQHAQPVSLAFYLMAYANMFARDYERFIASAKQNNLCPLGACAMAGTPHPTNRARTAELLGFDAPTANAMDSVSDRDFALEILFNISVLFMHTSRLCEELILWNSQEFSFVKMSDKFSTGSSIMPQKKNPDVAELIRGKTGRVYGNLIALLTTMKSLPLAYNKDMQEDKERVFDSVETAKKSVEILTQMLLTCEFSRENLQKACEKGHLSATDLADFLVREKGVAFREAHFITGRCVGLAESLGVDLSAMKLADLQKIDQRIDEKAMEALSLISSKNARKSFGGTSDESVNIAVVKMQEWIKERE